MTYQIEYSGQQMTAAASTAYQIEHDRLLRRGWRLDADGCYRKGAAQ